MAYPSDVLKEALQVAIDRNQNLNLFMRNFAELVKLPEADKKHIDLCKLVSLIPRLMTLQAGEKQISLNATVPEKPFIIFADEHQVEQALLNVVKNAMEAIGEKGAITLHIDPKKRKLTVTDTGKGISATEHELLFTPFYTTKKDGQGIGLMLVKEILLNHGFEFSLKTVAENCTEFVIGF